MNITEEGNPQGGGGETEEGDPQGGGGEGGQRRVTLRVCQSNIICCM